MYEVGLSDKSHYTVQCISYYKNPVVVSYVVDTGAVYTCCRYDFLDLSLRQEDFDDGEAIVLGGFVNNEYMKFYPLELKQFTIGNIDLGKQKIWITFDERISENLLGVDILSKVWYCNHPEKEKLQIFRDKDEMVRAIRSS